jgi:hypothetical protein
MSSCGANVVSEVCKPLIRVAIQDSDGTKTSTGAGSGTTPVEPKDVAAQAEVDAEAAVAAAEQKIKDDYLANFIQPALSFRRRSTVDATNATNTVTTITTEFKGQVPTDALTSTGSTFFDFCSVYVGNIRAFSCSELTNVITFTPNSTDNSTVMEFALNSTTLTNSTSLSSVLGIGVDANIGTNIDTVINELKTGTLSVSVVFMSSQISPLLDSELGGQIVYRLFAKPSTTTTALETLEY